MLLNASFRVTVKFGPFTGAPVDARREPGRRRDGEVGDLHDRAVVDRQQDPIADGIDVVEVVDDHGRVVADSTATWSSGSAGLVTDGNIGPG